MLNLSAILREIARQRWTVVAVTALFLLIGVVRALLAGQTFQAQTMLAVTSVPAARDSAVYEVLPKAYKPRVYEIIANSYDVIGATLEELVQAGAFEDDPPDSVEFRQMIAAETELVDQTTRPMDYAPLLILRAEADDPDLAAQIVDAWAKTVTRAAKQASVMVVAPAQQLLEATKEDYFAELRVNWEEKYDQISRADPELLREELTTRVETIQGLEQQIASARAALAAEKETLATAQAALAEQPEKLELRRAPTDTAYWLSLQADPQHFERPNPLLESAMVTEIMNPEHTRLLETVNTARASIASGKARVETLETELEDLLGMQDQGRSAMAETELALDRIDAQLAYLTSTFETLAQQEAMLQAGVALAKGEAEGMRPIGLNRLLPVSYAIEYQPLINRKLQVIVAAFLGLVVSVTLISGRLAWNALVAQFASQKEA